MRLPRMTMRRWMIAVAVVGLMMGGLRLKRRHDAHLDRSRRHAHSESTFRAWRKMLEGTDLLIERIEKQEGDNAAHLAQLKAHRAVLVEMAPSWEQGIPYHAALVRKYRHAARYPWLPVEPDPPTPRMIIPSLPAPPVDPSKGSDPFDPSEGSDRFGPL
jgi:hypothetical protein